MRLSTENAFEQMAFPQLRKQESGSEEEGYIHGHAAGYTAGLRAADADHRRRVQELESDFAARRQQQEREALHLNDVLKAAAAALNARTIPVVASAEDALVAGAVELAEALVGYELKDAQKAARAALARAVSGSKGLDVVTIRMNPRDLSVLTDGMLDAGIRLSADPTMGPGDAVAELPNGFLDAKIGTALARVKEQLAVDRP